MNTLLIVAPPDTAAPLRCMLVDMRGAIMERRDLAFGDSLPASFQHDVVRTVLAAPGTEVRTLWLDLPAQSPLQALAAAHQLLDGQASGANDSQHVTLSAAHDAQPRLVAVTDRQAMHEWLQRCASFGLVPDVVLPDHLLLPAPVAVDEMHVVDDAGRWLVRGATLAFSAEAGLARQVLEHRQLRIEPGSDDLDGVLARGAAAEPAINMMQYEFAPAAAPRIAPSRRRLAVLAMALLLSPAVLVGAEAARYQWAARTLEQQAAAIALPPAAEAAASTGTGTMASPAAQARARNLLFEALSRSPGVRLQALRSGSAAGLEAELVHATPAQLQGINDTLVQSSLHVEIDPSSGEGSELRTLIRLRPQA